MNALDTTKTLTLLPNSVSVMIKGNHGIGKSEIVKLAARQLGIPCIDFRLSQNDVGDIKGIPSTANGRTIFCPPEFFPITEADAAQLKELLGLAADVSMGRFGDKGILFLDEINRASREVQQAAFELVLDRRLNMRSLPEGWRVVTAINDNDDLYTVGSLDPAFVSRFMVIDFNPTYEEWMIWARANDVHDAVITFLTKNPELLEPTTDIISENNKDGVRKLYDRRSWHKFSDTIKEFDRLGQPLLKKGSDNLSYMTQVATGFLGSTCAIKFRSFVENDYDSLSADIILSKWDTTVADKLQSIVDAGRIPELAAYNDLIVEYIRKKGKLTKANKVNISKYVGMMPKEIVSGFWQHFNKDLYDLSLEWYNFDIQLNSQIILNAIVNPDALK